jgi:site-specific DNA-methyltransferase (adenine-specific)
MIACGTSVEQAVTAYLKGRRTSPLFLCGDAGEMLRHVPAGTVDCIVTSPPYWKKRHYNGGGIGLEDSCEDYVESLCRVIQEARLALKDCGSLWLNLGDTYCRKGLAGVPWRVALRLVDKEQWTLRNSVIWNKVKGGLDNTKDRLGNIHEHVFHFVKDPDSYYYDVDAIRSQPQQCRIANGEVISATGVRGVRYKQQIEDSKDLTHGQKADALRALQDVLAQMRDGDIADFRMVIRGTQRATHSDRPEISGRAQELQRKGFYILRYHPKGSKPADVWNIIPEDTQGRSDHFAPYPLELCRIPILATCPPEGIVLDPFCGTGTTMLAAMSLGRRSVGIDISPDYLAYAEARCGTLL